MSRYSCNVNPQFSAYALTKPDRSVIICLLMSDCIFCKIVSGEIKSKIIREDDFTLSFLDLNPQAPTHVLIIPKKHISSLSAASEEDIELLGRIQFAAAETARLLKVEKSFRLVSNNGKGAGQSVAHLHYHLLAGRKLLWPPG